MKCPMCVRHRRRPSRYAAVLSLLLSLCLSVSCLLTETVSFGFCLCVLCALQSQGCRDLNTECPQLVAAGNSACARELPPPYTGTVRSPLAYIYSACAQLALRLEPFAPPSHVLADCAAALLWGWARARSCARCRAMCVAMGAAEGTAEVTAEGTAAGDSFDSCVNCDSNIQI